MGRARRHGAFCLVAWTAAVQALAADTQYSSSPKDFIAVGDVLYFTAEDVSHGRELWKYTSANGARLAADIEAGPRPSNPSQLLECRGCLVFTANTTQSGREVWFYEPVAGTAARLPLSAPAANLQVYDLVPAGSNLFFATIRSETAQFLFGLSPDSMKLEALALVPTILELSYAQLDTGVTLVGALNNLIVSDGTATGTRYFSRQSWIADSKNPFLTSVGQRAFFLARDEEHGYELWSTDGTPEQTSLVKDVWPGPTNSDIGQVTLFNGRVLFHAEDGVHGRELWVSDGTPEGTQLLLDIAPGAASSDPHYFRPVEQWMYFAADNGTQGNELWRTDGTPGGTQLVTEVNPGPPGADIWGLTAARNRLYFAAGSSEYGEELFEIRTDVNTPRCLELVPGTRGGGPNHMFVFQDHLFFAANDGRLGEELYRISLENPDNPELAGDINTPLGTEEVSSFPKQLTPFQEGLLFSATDREHGNELWFSDGTEQGTLLLADIAPGSEDATPGDLAAVGDRAFFTARNVAAGRELWMTSGPSGSTEMVMDLVPGPAGSDPKDPVAAGSGQMLFTANDGAHERGLWVTRGTPETTHTVAFSAQAASSARIGHLFAFDGRIYFYLEGPNARRSLWSTDGTSAGTRCLLADIEKIAPVGAGFRLAPGELPALLFSGNGSSNPAIAQLDHTLFFAANVPPFGGELFQTGTGRDDCRIVADAYPGRPSSSPANFTVAKDMLYFTADTPRRGPILWRTNGNPENTGYVMAKFSGSSVIVTPTEMARLPDGNLIAFAPHPLFGKLGTCEICRLELQQGSVLMQMFGLEFGSKPHRLSQLTPAGGLVYFVCNAQGCGDELWATDGTPEGTRLVRDILPSAADAGSARGKP